VLRRVVRKLFDGPPNEGDALPLGAESCVIKPVGVAPECRFSNAAVDLMQAGEAEARRRGATRLIGLVERSNTKAARLYAFLGWARTSPEREDFGVYAMHKDLAPP
jgi:GNAT superfamily N-acetyltransferase